MLKIRAFSLKLEVSVIKVALFTPFSQYLTLKWAGQQRANSHFKAQGLELANYIVFIFTLMAMSMPNIDKMEN